MEKKIILIADDEATVRHIFRISLEAEGYQVFTVSNGQEAMELLRREKVHLLITDLVMPYQEGIETITMVKKEFPGVKTLAISGYSEQYLELADMLGADSTLAKPFEIKVLSDRVKSIIG